MVVVQALVNVGSVLFVDVPEDRIYRYSNAALTLLQFGVLLAVVLLIARPRGLREALALRRPVSWRNAAALGALVMVGTLVLVVALGPLLDAGDAQKWPRNGIPTGSSPSWSMRW